MIKTTLEIIKELKRVLGLPLREVLPDPRSPTCRPRLVYREEAPGQEAAIVFVNRLEFHGEPDLDQGRPVAYAYGEQYFDLPWRYSRGVGYLTLADLRSLESVRQH